MICDGLSKCGIVVDADVAIPAKDVGVVEIVVIGYSSNDDDDDTDSGSRFSFPIAPSAPPYRLSTPIRTSARPHERY